MWTFNAGGNQATAQDEYAVAKGLFDGARTAGASAANFAGDFGVYALDTFEPTPQTPVPEAPPAPPAGAETAQIASGDPLPADVPAALDTQPAPVQ